MKVVKIKFTDEWQIPEDWKEENVYDSFLEYLSRCVRFEDVTAFDFEITDTENNNEHS